MDIIDYHRFALSTAIYRGLEGGNQPTYPALGLAGEAGEICEKLADGIVGEELAKELGDVLWYIANLAEDMGADMLSILPASLASRIEQFDAFQAVAAEPGPPPCSSTPNLEPHPAALRLAGKAGMVCERAKKLIRDDGGTLTDERRSLIASGLAEAFVAVANLASALGANLDDIAAANVRKLRSRKERGRITGDGDNR